MFAKARLELGTSTFSAILYFALFLCLLRVIYHILTLSGIVHGLASTVVDVFFRIFLIPTQFLTALIFCYCLVRFLRSESNGKSSGATKDTMNRLMWLSAAGSLSLVTVSVLNTLGPSPEISDSANGMVMATAVRYMVATLRGTALLLLVRLE